MASKFLIVVRQLFYVLLVRPLLIILLGFNCRHLERLPCKGPHLIAVNHNSHLDALVLMSLFKYRDVPKLRLVAAKDYFCRNAFMTWFSLNIIGIIPIDRKGAEKTDPLLPVHQALEQGMIVIIFPEGTRGDPELRQPFKYGISKLIQHNPQIAVTPVYMHGLGKSLPRGEALFVPFVCEINVGEPMGWNNDRSTFIHALEQEFIALEQEIQPKPWQ